MNKPTTWIEMFSFVKDNLSGEGLEISCLHNKFEINSNIVMEYCDIKTKEELVEIYKTDKSVDTNLIPKMDYIIKNNIIPTKKKYNFICNSHVIEHVNDVFNCLKHWLSLLKKDGYIYIIIPVKDFTFDRERSVTELSHFIKDYEDNKSLIPIEHYLDYCNHVEKNASRAAEAYGNQENIHVHVFNKDSIYESFKYFEFLGYKIVFIEQDGMHCSVLLQENK